MKTIIDNSQIFPFYSLSMLGLFPKFVSLTVYKKCIPRKNFHLFQPTLLLKVDAFPTFPIQNENRPFSCFFQPEWQPCCYKQLNYLLRDKCSHFYKGDISEFHEFVIS